MPARLSLEVFQKIAEERGGRCLSTEYVRNTEKLDFECSAGHRWSTTGLGIKNTGSWCPSCAADAKLTLDVFQEIAVARGGRCLSTEYIGIHKKLDFECSAGHRWSTTGNRVKNKNCWCFDCSVAAKRLSLDVFQEIAVARGGRCLSTEYFNKEDDLKFECSEGHIWTATGGSIKNTGSWCPVCSGCAPLSIDVFQKIAEALGGRCLSTEYINKNENLKFECSEGHVWTTTGDRVKNQGQWCPVCSTGRGEKEALSFASDVSGLSFKKARPKWLRSPKGKKMEIDGYCESAGLAIEYQGRQHYEYVPSLFHRNGPEDFAYQLEKDRLKARLVAARGILLLAVSASPKADPASVRAAVVKAAENACIPLFGVNREFTEMVLAPSRRFSACVLSSAVALLCGDQNRVTNGLVRFPVGPCP